MIYQKQQLEAMSDFEVATDIKKITSNLQKNFYDDLESTICNCMAAGVPASAMVLTRPHLAFNGNSVAMNCNIGFMPLDVQRAF